MKALPSRYSIVAGCDREADRRDRFAAWAIGNGSARKEGLSLFEDAGDLAHAIRRQSLPVDLAILATGPESHPDILLKLLRSGVRRFVCEKPVAMSARQARGMVESVRKAGARVHVNFERRYHPAYRLVKTLIEEQRFGPLRHVEGRVLAPSGERDALLEDAVHWIDLLLWYAGEPLGVTSRYRLEGDGRERSSLHVFRYPEFDAVLESGGARRYFEFFMRLDFERGRIHAGNDGHVYFESRPSKRYAGFRELRPISFRVPVRNPWVEMYREVAADSGCSSPLADAVTGLEWIERCRRFKGKFRGSL